MLHAGLFAAGVTSMVVLVPAFQLTTKKSCQMRRSTAGVKVIPSHFHLGSSLEQTFCICHGLRPRTSSLTPQNDAGWRILSSAYRASLSMAP